MVHLFLFQTGIFPRGLYRIYNNTLSSGEILVCESVSFISLGENQLMSQNNGSLLLRNNIRLASNTPIVSNIRTVSNKCLVGLV